MSPVSRGGTYIKLKLSATATPDKERCKSTVSFGLGVIRCGQRHGHVGTHKRNLDGTGASAVLEWLDASAE